MYFQIIPQNPYINLDFAGVYMCQCQIYETYQKEHVFWYIYFSIWQPIQDQRTAKFPGYPSRISSSTRYKYILVSLLFSGTVECMWDIFICTSRVPSLRFLTAGQNLRNRDSTSQLFKSSPLTGTSLDFSTLLGRTAVDLHHSLTCGYTHGSLKGRKLCETARTCSSDSYYQTVLQKGFKDLCMSSMSDCGH